MNPYDLIEAHYRANRLRYMKWLTFRTGAPESADDIIQEAYYRALKYHQSCREGEGVNKWFGRIISRCLIDFKNEENGQPKDEFIEEEAEGTACPHYPSHIMREVFELIDTKSLVQKEVLNMYFKNEYTAHDISQITEYSYAQCHKIISRFREELRQLYK